MIHRTRYGGDWCLPKGKLEPGEFIEEAALREVKEELGFGVRITSFAGHIKYKVKAVPKYVFFWNMVPVDASTFMESGEVREMLWLTPREAVKTVDYPEEKKLLARVFKVRRGCSLGRIIRCLTLPFRQPLARRRLAGTLAAYRQEFENRTTRVKARGESTASWAPEVQSLLRGVDQALEDCNIDEGWKFFLAAQRIELFGYDESELRARAVQVQIESEKNLRSWRKDSVSTLLKRAEELRAAKGGGSGVGELRNLLYEATLALHGEFNNQYFRLSFNRQQMATLAVILLLVPSGVIAFLSIFPVSNELMKWPPGWQALIAVALFGLLGGAFSSILSLAKIGPSGKIPDVIASSVFTSMRAAIGGAAAIAVYVFTQSNIVHTVVAFDIKSPGTVLFLSFAAGFSEFLVTYAVKAVAGGSKNPRVYNGIRFRWKRGPLRAADESAGVAGLRLTLEYT